MLCMKWICYIANIMIQLGSIVWRVKFVADLRVVLIMSIYSFQQPNSHRQSEYGEIHRNIMPCLSSTEKEKNDTMIKCFGTLYRITTPEICCLKRATVWKQRTMSSTPAIDCAKIERYEHVQIPPRIVHCLVRHFGMYVLNSKKKHTTDLYGAAQKKTHTHIGKNYLNKVQPYF